MISSDPLAQHLRTYSSKFTDGDISADDLNRLAAVSVNFLFGGESDKRIAEALHLIHQFGGIDGAHHKQWVLDQLVRTLTGSPSVVKSAVDAKGYDYNYEALGESPEYLAWVAGHNAGEEGPDTYGWDVGIVP